MAIAEATAADTPDVVSKSTPWQKVELHDAGWWVDIGIDPLVMVLDKALKESLKELDMMGSRRCTR